MILDLTREVPQGSVVGPLLWNLTYDGVLRIEYSDGVTPVGFANDLALVVVGRTEEVQHKVVESVRLVTAWMGERSLKWALHKTQVVIMAGRR